MTDSRGDGTWNTYYKWINNAKEIQRLNAQLASPEPNYEAVSLTLQSWMYGILADAFGDIPMSEACSADQGILAPRFDRQEQAYRQILDNLKTANSLFDTESGLVYTLPETCFTALPTEKASRNGRNSVIRSACVP